MTIINQSPQNSERQTQQKTTDNFTMSDAAVPEVPVSSTKPQAAGENGESAAPDQKDDKDKASGEQAALQQQIQAQLQQQLQSQLQAAAQKGKQANITPEMIQVRARCHKIYLVCKMRSLVPRTSAETKEGSILTQELT